LGRRREEFLRSSDLRRSCEGLGLLYSPARIPFSFPILIPLSPTKISCFSRSICAPLVPSLDKWVFHRCFLFSEVYQIHWATSLNLFTYPRQPDHQLAPCSTELHWMHVVSDHKQTVENKEHILAGPTSVASFSINLHLPFLTPAFHQC
jgi:hypothetical protein